MFKVCLSHDYTTGKMKSLIKGIVRGTYLKVIFGALRDSPRPRHAEAFSFVHFKAVFSNEAFSLVFFEGCLKG